MINLQMILVDYKLKKRELPTYLELMELDLQIAAKDAQIAALRQTILTIIHEQKAISDAYFSPVPHGD
jgi:hypothetical protein